MLLFIFIAFAFFKPTIPFDITNTTFVESRFFQNSIITDMNLPNGPRFFLQIYYPRGLVVNLGNVLPVALTKNAPRLIWGPVARERLYAVLMIDPDAPSRNDPQLREFRHWFVVNISTDRSRRGDTIFEYLPPAPPKNTGLHRYVFLVFQQNGTIDVTDIPKFDASSLNGRSNTNTKDLMTEYGFNTPLFGNFFQAQYEI